ncbi:peptide deformylase, putative [Plasmodium ovale]|uniref:Peptide deformylase n=1 Tax=Plasmodium ovale TaxID=36330 RepID=A0A1D3U7I5_PLAOA|nr:peptide deformylase, putative [Plasmodium ovale]
MGFFKYVILLLVVLSFTVCSAYIFRKNGNFNLCCNNTWKNKRMVTVRLTSEKNEIKIVMYPNHVLRKKSEDVVTFDDDLRNLVRNMFNIMYASKGIGLSAPQVNISKRIIVWNALYEKRKEENERVFINPSIVESSLIKTKAIEGCLSFPNVEGKIERPSIVSISYYDLNGNKHLKILKGIHSRIFQHEFDHLNGVLFIDRMSQTEKHKIRAKFNELIRQYRNNCTDEPAI